MPKAIPNPELQSHHGLRAHEGARANGAKISRPPTMLDMGPGYAGLEPWEPDPLLSQGLNSLAGETHPTAYAERVEAALPAEADQLAAENNHLREIISELQGMVGTGDASAHVWTERQKEYESLLEEKSELIRALHLKVRELEQQPAAAVTPHEEELLATSDDLDRERAHLEQERRRLDEEVRQFKEDEETMTQQMREMEVQMARERAELARQRNDLQRILDEIRHELERVERDGGLNEKLGYLRQRYQDVVKGGGGGAPPTTVARATTLTATAGLRKVGPTKKDSSLIRRIFG